jgi:hypothetical protein
MPGNASLNSTPRFQGTTFDDMVEALTKGFGSFHAWRNGREKPLDWKVGFWGDERLSLVSNQDSGNWVQERHMGRNLWQLSFRALALLM